MKRIIYVFIFAICLFAIGNQASAQKVAKSPKSVLSQTVGLTEITVTYFRPGLKGRSMESLAPTGKVWRTGANNSTALLISNAITIGSKELPAGNYSLWTIPADGEWTIIINSKHGWGTQYDEAGDVMRFSAKATKTAETTETMTIDISDIDANGKDAAIEIRWGNVSVKAPFSVSQ